jgi:hypothetical protein
MRQPRTFDGLRGPRPPEEPATRTLEDDIRDLFATPMGQVVLAGLVEESHAPSPEGAEDRALREKEGARKFVARLRARASRDGQRRSDS